EELVKSLNEHLGSDDVRFYTGTGYRNLLVYEPRSILDIETTPPHQAMGELLMDILPTGKGSGHIIEIMRASKDVLENQEVNEVRRDLGQNPANMIWLWGEGSPPSMEPFSRKYGLSGKAISAVNLVRGLARLVGWDIIEVPGITGFTDTDYGAKGRYAIDALNNDAEIVLVHVEAPDEASHEQDARAKVRAIEQIDQNVVGPVLAAGDDFKGFRMMVMSDHITSVEKGRHMRGMVPMAMWGEGIRGSFGGRFDEGHAGKTDIVWDEGHDLMTSFVHK
ncbi:MAG: phosphoglycerate mutase, partial [Planctomycetota bacterium]